MMSSLKLGFLTVTLVTGLGLSAQDAPAKPDPKVKVQLKEYQKILKDKRNKMGTLDGEATEIVNQLLERFDSLHKSDKAAFTKALAGTFKWAKRQPQNSKLYQMAIRALGKTGTFGSMHLKKLFTARVFTSGGKKKKDEWNSVRELVLKQAGATKDEKLIGWLTDVALKNAESDGFMAEAGGALGNYHELPLKKRKPIFKQLFKKLKEIHNQAKANVDPGDLNRALFDRRLRAISARWNSTLQKLSGQKLKTPNEWEKFYNKNKSKDWDKLKRS